MVRIGLIGAGRHGIRYARHLKGGDVPGARLAAFWRRDRGKGEALAAELSTRFEPSYQALIQSADVEAVIAAVPVAYNLDIALEVARAKKPLLLEKPIARTVAEATRIVDAFRTAGVTLTVAQTLRFDPLLLRLRARLGELGGLRGFSFEQRIEPRGLAWEDEPETSGGGVLIQTGIHTLDALRFVTGVDRIEVAGARFARMQYRHNEDHALLQLQISVPGQPSIIGDVASSKIGHSRHMRFALFLESCGLSADLIERTLTETRGRERTTAAIPDDPTIPPLLQAFVRCVEGHGPNPIPGEEGTRSLALVEAAYRMGR